MVKSAISIKLSVDYHFPSSFQLKSVITVHYVGFKGKWSLQPIITYYCDFKSFIFEYNFDCLITWLSLPYGCMVTWQLSSKNMFFFFFLPIFHSPKQNAVMKLFARKRTNSIVTRTFTENLVIAHWLVFRS